jgi:hypothetical protein
MDAFAELAAYDESAIPVVAGLAARTLMRGRAAQLPMAARRQLVRGMATAARTLTRHGPTAVRALPTELSAASGELLLDWFGVIGSPAGWHGRRRRHDNAHAQLSAEQRLAAGERSR